MKKINKKDIFTNSKNALEKINQKDKVISLAGNNGEAKAAFTTILVKKLERKKLKTLIIDLDILNQKLFEKLKIKNKEIKNLNIEEHIINKNKYISLLSGKNLLFKINDQITTYEIEQIIEKLKEKYQHIIIITTLECFFKVNKMILEKTNKVIFLIEKSIREIERSKKLLKIYWKNWKIEKTKFNIILFKINKQRKLEILDKIPYQTPIDKEENGTNTYQQSRKRHRQNNC